MTMSLIPGIPEAHYADLPNGHRIHYIDKGEGAVVMMSMEDFLALEETAYLCTYE